MSALGRAGFRIAAGGLALAAAALAVAGDHALFRASVQAEGAEPVAAWVNPLFEALWTAEVLLACALALAIVWRAAGRPDARALAWFLVLFSLAGFEGTLRALGLLPVEEFGGGAAATAGQAALAVVAAAPWWLALAAFLRFAALFPRPLSARDVERADGGERTARLLDPRVVWGGAVALSILTGLAGLAIRAGSDRVGVPVGMLAFTVVLGGLAALLWGIVHGVRLLRIRYRTAVEAERRRILWVVQAFWVALWLIVVGIAGLVPATFAVLGGGGWIWPAVPILAIAGAPLVIVVFLAVAIFYDGALDPALVVRRTALYGAFGVVLTFVFAAVETVASGWLVGRLGLPEGSGGWIAGGVVAVFFGVLRHTLARRIERWVPPAAAGSAGG